MGNSKNDEVYDRNIGMQRLKSLVEKLRDPISGCPWDIEQNSKSIAHYCVEEAHELQHAISLGKTDAIKSELGDLLFQIAFHCNRAEKEHGLSFVLAIFSHTGQIHRAVLDLMYNKIKTQLGADRCVRAGKQNLRDA